MAFSRPPRFGDLVPARWQWPAAAALFSVALVYAFWWLPHTVRPWNDFAFVYAAGRSWLGGFSPYDYERWNAEWVAIRPSWTVVSQPMPFMYPPHWGPIAVTMARLPWPQAALLWDAINVVAFGLTCVIAVKLLGGHLRTRLTTPTLWIFLALATLNPALRYSMMQSQMTIIPALGVVGAFYAWQHHKRLWLIAFAFLASLKPQIGVLALLYIFLNGGHIPVMIAGVVALATGLLYMAPTLASFPHDLARCYGLHMKLAFNQPGEFFNLPALAAGYVSGHEFMVVGPVLAVILVGAVTYVRRRRSANGVPSVLQDPLWQLSIVCALTGALMPVHGYDLVIYTPLALLAYRLRATWMSPLVAGFLLLAARPLIIVAALNIKRPAPLMTTALAITVAAAAYLVSAERRTAPVPARS